MTTVPTSLLRKSLSAVALLVLSIIAGARTWADSTIQLDVTYGRGDGQELKLDLALPPTGDGPFPMVVFIHGGGWSAGSKSLYDPIILACANQGYVAASVEYRFAPRYKFPAQIEDVKCAVRYLRAHAKQLKGDPKRVGAVGDSAGGHLALLLGLMDARDGLEGTGGWPDQPSKVQVVVNYYGPSDLRTIPASDTDAVNLVESLLGTTDLHAPIAAMASPITYIDKNDAPVLTMHGGKDTLVPPSQSHALHEALARAGVEEHLEIFPEAQHGFGGADSIRAFSLTKEFLDRHLKPR